MRSDGYAAVFDIFSLARGLHRRPDGTFLLVHTDLPAEDPPVSTEALWVSVLRRITVETEDCDWVPLKR